MRGAVTVAGLAEMVAEAKVRAQPLAKVPHCAVRALSVECAGTR